MHVKNRYFSLPVYPPETDNWSSQESCRTPRRFTVTFGNEQHISLALTVRCSGQILLHCNAPGPPNWSHLVDGNTGREPSPLASKKSASTSLLKNSTIKDKKGVAWVLLYHSALWSLSGSLGCFIYRTGGTGKLFWFITPSVTLPFCNKHGPTSTSSLAPGYSEVSCPTGSNTWLHLLYEKWAVQATLKNKYLQHLEN